MVVIYWPTKKPEEELDYTLDWSHVLEDDELIVDSTWHMPDTTSLLKTNEYYDNHETTIWLAGGDASETPYLLTNVIVTDVDSTYSQDVFLPIYQLLANICDMTGKIMGPTGEPVLDMQCSFSVINNESLLNNMGVSAEPVCVYTDSNGFFSAGLIIGSQYRIYIPDLGLMAPFTVPDTSSANVFEFISI